MKRLTILPFLVGLLACNGQGFETKRAPNILLISIDTLRADHLGCYGYERDTSPFLDRLAREGVRYENAVVNTHGTTPSHTSILTSLYQESHRVAYSGRATDKVPEEAVLLQEVLGEAGYLTLGVTGGGNAGRKFGFARGFDEFNDRSRSVRAGKRRLLRMIAEAQGSGKPIFVFFHTYQVHSPYFPPKNYKNIFGDFKSDYIPSSENLLESVASAQDLEEEDLSYIVAMYDAGIRFTDDVLREIFGELETMGFLKDALVVLTSDHGEEFGEHGGLLHRGLLYEELLRVPLIFWGSRFPRGVLKEAPTSSIDIAPTLLACAGRPIPSQMQGRALHCRTDEKGQDAAFAISQYGKSKYAVRTKEWKYIESTDPPGAELYHLGRDSEEKRNLARAHPDLVRKFRRELVSFRKTQKAIQEESSAAELSEEEKEHLKALGYLNTD